MRICLIHNKYGRTSGEEVMISHIIDLLRKNSHDITCFFRSSREVANSFRGNLGVFFSGIYSTRAKAAFRQFIRDREPDIIQVQNVYPLISPSVLLEAAENKIPVVMRCANYRLICPNGLFLRDGRICEECSGGREWKCVLHNCESSVPKSLGYALRNYVARTRRYYLDNVTIYCAQTEFQRERLIQEGLPADRVHVIPNMIASNGFNVNGSLGRYVGFVGRVSPEKGVSTLVRAARICADVQFKAAGSYERMPDIVANVPRNFDFSGHLDKRELQSFYADSRMIVVPSVCYEGFPSVLPEAMVHAKPVICSRIGGLPEIVDDGKTGLLFEPGNAGDLADKIRYLWDRPDLCSRMGRAGREKALREYSPDKYYERLMAVFRLALDVNMSLSGNQSTM